MSERRAELVSVTIYCTEDGAIVMKSNIKECAKVNIPYITEIVTKHGDNLSVDIAHAIGMDEFEIIETTRQIEANE